MFVETILMLAWLQYRTQQYYFSMDWEMKQQDEKNGGSHPQEKYIKPSRIDHSNHSSGMYRQGRLWSKQVNRPYMI